MAPALGTYKGIWLRLINEKIYTQAINRNENSDASGQVSFLLQEKMNESRGRKRTIWRPVSIGSDRT